LRYHIDQLYINQTKFLAQRMYELGMITNIPDVELIFNLDFLNGLYN